MFAGVKAIIFDLDGTLYVNAGLAQEIKASSTRYIASLSGVDDADARFLIEDTQERLSAVSGRETTLSAACMELGGDIRQLHNHFAAEIKPELFLERNEGLVKILGRLANGFDLYLYTNNNRFLCGRIMKSLGISEFFRAVFTIEDCWRPKPDVCTLEKIFADIGRLPAECLFIGDRYDVDLRLPATFGSPVFLVRNVQELMSLLQDIINGKINLASPRTLR